ncbi:MAG: ATPase, T2SS/T4P/T4SS family, partial [Actinomycetota bacterium]
MYTPNQEEFIARSQRGNLVPVYREILADLETPVSAFLKVGARPHSFLLESVAGGEHISRFSFIGGDPFMVFKSKGPNVWITRDGQTERRILAGGEDPLSLLKGLMDEFQFVADPELPPFCGGAVGYIGYDAVRFFERLPDTNPDDRHLPDCYFVFTDTLLIFDHVKHRIKVLCLARVGGDPAADYDSALAKIDAIVGRLQAPLSATDVRPEDPFSEFSRLGALLEEAHLEAKRLGGSESEDDHHFQGPLVRIAHTIITEALKAKASEIQIEQRRKRTVVSLIVDGAAHEVMELPVELYRNLAMRYKVMAGMNFTEGRYPKGQKIPVSFQGRDHDLIMDFDPAPVGERITMRTQGLPDEAPIAAGK